MATRSLFEPDLPKGFRYQEGLITPAEEAELVSNISVVEFATFEMRGVVAKRRVAFYGQSYDEGPARPIADFLLPLRAKVAAWVGIAPDDFGMALINEYQPGAPIGWHRDAPQYEIVAGVSLLSGATMKLRPYISPAALARNPPKSPRRTTHQIELAPRSVYLISEEARREYEHHIPPTKSLRYSVTFRTLR